jgi:hypothetical protein
MYANVLSLLAGGGMLAAFAFGGLNGLLVGVAVIADNFRY